MKRRTFIKTAGLTTLSACSPGPIGQVLPAQAAESRLPATGPLSGRRILTFNSVIRVNQIEVTRTRNEGFDEYDRHTPENIKALRDAFAAGWPGAPTTWALSWRALEEPRPNYQAARRTRASRQVSWLPGRRLIPDLPRSPLGLEWRRVLRLRGGLAGYSGGTAQAFNLLPSYPPEAGGTLTLREAV